MRDKEDIEELYPLKKDKKDKRRSTAQKRAGAKEIIKILNWLSQPCIYWSGHPPNFSLCEYIFYQPINLLIAEKAKRLKPGIYTVKIKYPNSTPNQYEENIKLTSWINPATFELLPVDQPLITRSVQALPAIKKYPKELPKLVGDVQEWQEKIEERLNRITRALKAIPTINKIPTDSLLVEDTCIWVGRDKDRPSKKIDFKVLKEWLEKGDKSSESGYCLGVIILGHRKMTCTLNKQFKKIWKVASILSQWPADIISTLIRWENINQLLDINLKKLNFREAALALTEFYLHTKNRNFESFLSALAFLNEEYGKLDQESDLRFRILLHATNKAWQNASQQFEYSSRQKSNGKNKELEQLFCKSFLSIFLRSLNKRGFSVSIKEFGPESIEDFAFKYTWGLDFPSYLFSHFETAKGIQGKMEELITGYQKLPPVNYPKKLTIFGLSGRLAGKTNSVEAITSLSGWFESCRIFMLKKHPEDDLVSYAIEGMEIGVAFSGWDKNNLLRLLGIISHYGSDLLSDALYSEVQAITRTIDSRGFASRMNYRLTVLARLGSLNLEQCDMLIKQDLIRPVEFILIKHKEFRLPAFINWAVARDKEWQKLPSTPKLDWAKLFSLKNKRMVSSIYKWAEKTVSSSQASWEQLTSYLLYILEFCVNKKDLHEYVYEHVDLPEEEARQEFLLNHLWVLDEIVKGIKALNKSLPQSYETDIFFNRDAFQRRVPILNISYFWISQRYTGLKKLIGRLLSHCIKQEQEDLIDKNIRYGCLCFPKNLHHLRLKVLISANDCNLFMKLLTVNWSTLTNAEDLLRAWNFLDLYPDIQEFLHRYCKRGEQIVQVFKLLENLSIARMLPVREMMDKLFATWINPQIKNVTKLPLPLSHLTEEKWRIFHAYLGQAGKSGEIPTEINKILNSPSSYKRELATITRKKENRQISASLLKREKKLVDLLNKPEKLTNSIESRLLKYINRQLPLIKIAALERLLDTLIHRHLKPVLRVETINRQNPDWANAIRLYYSTAKNKRLLKKILSNLGKGDRRWIAAHPQNQNFSKKMEKLGINIKTWMKGFEKKWKVAGGQWRVYSESNPLKILQMGNLFGTCLSIGGSYAYSTIANAVEINKHILFMENEKGHIIGRKLILLHPQGKLFGCNSYGSTESYYLKSGGSPWVKILFDLLCLDIVNKCNLKFPEEKDYDEIDEDPFKMFSHWYFDGIEDFDCWITDHLAKKNFNKNKITAALRKEILERIKCKSPDEELLRLMIWLGDQLVPILDKITSSATMKNQDFYFISRFTMSKKVKEPLLNIIKE
jgi:hypothetical protein